MVRVEAGLEKEAVLESGLEGGDTALADKAHARVGRDGLIFAAELSGRRRQPRLDGLPLFSDQRQQAQVFVDVHSKRPTADEGAALAQFARVLGLVFDPPAKHFVGSDRSLEKDEVAVRLQVGRQPQELRKPGRPSVQTHDGSKARIEGGARLAVDPDALRLGLDSIDSRVERREPSRGLGRRRVGDGDGNRRDDGRQIHHLIQVVQFLGRQNRRRRGGGAIGFGQRGHGDERRQGVGDDGDGFSGRGKVTSGRGGRQQRLLVGGGERRHD